MTPLAARLVRRIAATGPITVADYMADCLMDPEHGYYATRDPFGAAGDFTTAPEISQMFGELVGLALAQAWVDQGRPDPFTLCELGPGRGTLMKDLLRATRAVQGFLDAAQVSLMEASPELRGHQARTLAGGMTLTWCTDLAELPDAPLFLVANEFFDALPIRQFRRDGAGWRERQIGLAGEGLQFGWGAATPFGALDHRLTDTQTGDVVELCPAASAVMASVAERIADRGGAALVVDYGGWRSLGDTLQALHGHADTDPLAQPGEADLTAHVDFEALAAAAKGVDRSALTPQGVFLERLGITARAQALAQRLTGAALESHIAAHRRLTHPDEMGSLFQAIGFVPRGAPPLPGLDRDPDR